LSSHVSTAAVRLQLEDDVLWATLDRPDVLNAINLAVVEGLEAMVTRAREECVKVLVLAGGGGSFCAGADLRELGGLIGRADDLRAFMARLGSVLDAVEAGPWVTVAVVHGYAVAGGCELLLAADVVVAADDARIGDRHVEYGLVPAAGGSVRLARRVPAVTARFLLLTGELLSGTEAARLGLVTIAVAPDRLEPEVRRIVDRLRSRGRSSLHTIKTMLAAAEDTPQAVALRSERELFVAHATTAADAAIGVAAFNERRTPRFD
jgi:enoyl-CoA hydratase